MIQHADEKHPVVAAFYKGRKAGPLPHKIAARGKKSPYSHIEMLLGRRPNSYFYECASSTVADGGVRIVSQKLEPTHWDCWMLSHISPDFVRAWFDANDSSKQRTHGPFGFLIRWGAGHKSALSAAEACAESMALSDPWRYDIATLASVVRSIGEPIPLQHAFILGPYAAIGL